MISVAKYIKVNTQSFVSELPELSGSVSPYVLHDVRLPKKSCTHLSTERTGWTDLFDLTCYTDLFQIDGFNSDSDEVVHDACLVP